MFDAANDLNLEEKCVCSKTYLSRHDGRERGRAEAKMKAPVDVLKREGCGKKKKKSSNECTWTGNSELGELLRGEKRGEV